MRLIDADKVDKIIQTFQAELSSDNDKIWNKNKLAYKYLAYTRRELTEAETIESVPKIIYCKDCKHYKEFTDSISSKTTKGCTLYYVAKNENGFCDEAEERTDK